MATNPNVERITVPANERRSKTVDGGILDGLYVDISADGSHFDLDLRGDSPTVRNIGFYGVNSNDSKDQLISVHTTGDALLENIYLGDGAIDGPHNTGIFVHLDTTGSVTFRRINVQGFPDNGIYASAPGHSSKDSGNAEIIFEQCYARNNNTANYRLASGQIVDSVSVSDGDVPNKSGQGKNSRCVWHKEVGEVLIERCDIDASGPHASQAIMSQDDDPGRRTVVRDSQVAPDGNRAYQKHSEDEIVFENVGYDPDTSVPDSVPQSAEAAATGSDEENGSQLDHDIRLTSDEAHYAFIVDGDAQQHDDGNASINPDDYQIPLGDMTLCAGFLKGGVDGFYVEDPNPEWVWTRGNQVSAEIDGAAVPVETGDSEAKKELEALLTALTEQGLPTTPDEIDSALTDEVAVTLNLSARDVLNRR